MYYGDEVGALGAPDGPDGDLAMRRPVQLFSALADPDVMVGRGVTGEIHTTGSFFCCICQLVDCFFFFYL